MLAFSQPVGAALKNNIHPMKFAKGALAALTAMAVIFFFWQIFFCSAEKDFKKLLFKPSVAAPDPAMPQGSAKAAPDPTESLDPGKSLFQYSSVNETKDFGSNTMAIPGALEDIFLVGLLSGDVPQAILENRKTQQTYYLSQGQSANGITVDEIHGRSVVLSSGDTKKTITI